MTIFLMILLASFGINPFTGEPQALPGQTQTQPAPVHHSVKAHLYKAH
jgi:hypothetical protein